MAIFKEGDVVKLKSGGPRMTVESHADDGKARCVWFVGNKREDSDFNENILKKVEEDTGGRVHMI